LIILIILGGIYSKTYPMRSVNTAETCSM
jgi:hypothetical protein